MLANNLWLCNMKAPLKLLYFLYFSGLEKQNTTGRMLKFDRPDGQCKPWFYSCYVGYHHCFHTKNCPRAMHSAQLVRCASFTLHSHPCVYFLFFTPKMHLNHEVTLTWQLMVQFRLLECSGWSEACICEKSHELMKNEDARGCCRC